MKQPKIYVLTGMVLIGLLMMGGDVETQSIGKQISLNLSGLILFAVGLITLKKLLNKQD